jgi:hydroxymethylpyrimidine pyrophosphatase-like HAD family hydrolase
MRLPMLNFNNEIIFSNQVPYRALNSIVNTFKKHGYNLEIHSFDDKYILINRSNQMPKFDVYLKSRTF